VADLDSIAEEAFLNAVQPAALETTLAALRMLETERQTTDRAWQQRLEHAQYEARLAQRQYDAVDPDNRLVAHELERRWEMALVEVDRLAEEYARLRRTELLPLDAAEEQEVRRLADDLPALWHSQTTRPVDRKRMLRLVVAAVTVTVDQTATGRRHFSAEILWNGGATTCHAVQCTLPGERLRTDAAVLALIRDWARTEPDHQIAEKLNSQGIHTRHGKAWTYDRVLSMRYRHGLATGCPIRSGSTAPRGDGLVSLRTAAQRFGISPATLRVWAHHGVIQCDQRCGASKLWIHLTEAAIARLDGSSTATGLPTLSEVMAIEQLAREEVWDRVRAGCYVAHRFRRGPLEWEWRLERAMLDNHVHTSPDHTDKQKEQHNG
jgi:hypothetical protein